MLVFVIMKAQPEFDKFWDLIEAQWLYQFMAKLLVKCTTKLLQYIKFTKYNRQLKIIFGHVPFQINVCLICKQVT